MQRRFADAGQMDSRLESIRGQLAERLAGMRCLVVGSAPQTDWPQVTPERVIAANGSGWIAARNGVAVADLTVVAGAATRSRKPVHFATQDAWRGLRTRELLFIAAFQTAVAGQEVIDSSGLTYERFSVLSAADRSAITKGVCGIDLATGETADRISTGIFACAVAVWAGAREVTLCGFSLSSGGHAYMTEDTPRFHQNGDATFLSLAHSLPARISTTSLDISRDHGIPLVA
jgi:hypothetical protein